MLGLLSAGRGTASIDSRLHLLTRSAILSVSHSGSAPSGLASDSGPPLLSSAISGTAPSLAPRPSPPVVCAPPRSDARSSSSAL
eukprot:3157605-Rhodomonas_salina.2